jgi:hypothetical protein
MMNGRFWSKNKGGIMIIPLEYVIVLPCIKEKSLDLAIAVN